MSFYVLIPAYKPEQSMLSFMDELLQQTKNIILVDDGGGEKYKPLFTALENKGITVLVHPQNMGKGKALKTGISYIMDNFPNSDIVTADCDGQHSVKDIMRVARALEENPDKLIIGGRALKENAPLRSRFGNSVMRNTYRLTTGIKVHDTQTGLRGIPSFMLDRLLELKGDRYEFEMNMLLMLREWEIKPYEIEIETIYINNNEGSHFDTVKDSGRILKQIFKYIFKRLFSFIKFAASSLTCFVIDWLSCLLFMQVIPSFTFDFLSFKGIEGNVFISSVLARIISSLTNYTINKRIVFAHNGRNSFIKYIALVVVVMILSSSVLTVITTLLVAGGMVKEQAVAIFKPIVDALFFVMNFLIQKKLIFKK